MRSMNRVVGGEKNIYIHLTRVFISKNIYHNHKNIKKTKNNLLILMNSFHITLQHRIDVYKGLRDRICFPSIRALYRKLWIITAGNTAIHLPQLLKWKAGKMWCLRSRKGLLLSLNFPKAAMTNFISKSDVYVY